jgi:hypothetical protein
MTDRTTELRRALVATVDAAPYEKPRPRRWVAVAAIAAFAVAGSVTGFATATVSQASTGAAIDEPDDATTAWVLSFARPKSELLGPILHVDSTESVDLALGPAPVGATGFVTALSCETFGTANEFLNSKWLGSIGCNGDTGIGGGGGGVFAVSEAGNQTFRVEPSQGMRYQAWIAWVREPPQPEPSAQQLLELSDGVVTRDEYIAAFKRFIACMAAGGYDMGEPTLTDTPTRFIYAIPGAAHTDGTDEFCYGTEFNQVDMEWQISNP